MSFKITVAVNVYISDFNRSRDIGFTTTLSDSVGRLTEHSMRCQLGAVQDEKQRGAILHNIAETMSREIFTPRIKDKLLHALVTAALDGKIPV